MLSIVTITISVITSSLFTLILSVFILDPVKEKKKYIFEEKKQVYESVLVFCQIVLFPNEAKYSLGVARYDIQALTDEERVENALNDIKMAVPKLMLITKNFRIIEATKVFLGKKDEDKFYSLLNLMRKDLLR